MNYSTPLELAQVVRPFLAEYWQAGPGTSAPHEQNAAGLEAASLSAQL